MRILILLLLINILYANPTRDNLYRNCKGAISMEGEPKHINSKSLPYSSSNAKKGGSFKTMGIGGFDSLDLFVLKGSKVDSLNLIYDTLMSQSQDEPFSIYPLIANRICVANDNSGVRFHIDKRARFNDNTKITAQDIKFSFDMLIERGDPSQARYYADIKEAIVINDSIIEFIFKNNQNKELPFIITQLYIVPKHFYFDNNKNTFGELPLRKPLGSGPYSIDKFEVNKYITYKRNENYWGRDLMINKGAYNFDSIQIEYYKDETVALRAFLAGNYDYRFEPQAKAWANDYDTRTYKEGKFKKIEFRHGLPTGMQGFYLNTRKKILQDKRVREAIMQAFDFEWSNKNLFFSQYKRTKSYYENSEYASSGLLSNHKDEVEILLNLKILQKDELGNLQIAPEYINELDSRILTQSYKIPSTQEPYSKRENLKYAKKLLEEAGYKVRDYKLVDSNGEQLRLTILLNSPLFERIVLPFKKNLAILGIELDIRLVDSAQYESRIKKFDYDIIVGVIPQSLFPGNEQDFFFSTLSADMSGSRNFAGVRSKAIDLLIIELNKSTKHEQRVAIVRAMDRILLWGFYVVPHYFSPNFRIALKSGIKYPKEFPPYSSPFSMYYYWWRE